MQHLKALKLKRAVGWGTFFLSLATLPLCTTHRIKHRHVLAHKISFHTCNGVNAVC